MNIKCLKRYKAVFFVDRLKGPKLSFGQAAKAHRKSKAFVQKWVQLFKEIGNIDNFLERV
ncbi:hypothetical protein WN55_02162 [Dufourea novaeangliae]|uniref:Mos1 transposase HTH domain-containing protein n=1 Tax=Dufourea novaeangliae TaxID=178035 RepID=A0A154NXE3_DUFNO|nr:hypothetical protein WN55_02162 [Dufourea novaeangliae]